VAKKATLMRVANNLFIGLLSFAVTCSLLS